MSVEHDADLPDARTRGSGSSDVEHIADPDDYNLRRHLKQLHDARERVKDVGNLAAVEEAFNSSFTGEQKKLLAAEAVADYIAELIPILGQVDRDDELLNEELVEVDGTLLTVRDLAEAQGRVIPEDIDRHNPLVETSGSAIIGRKSPPYEVSRMAASVCDNYFMQVAGAEFVKGTPDPEHNPIDPSGRFNE